jgi:hypothetical protein
MPGDILDLILSADLSGWLTVFLVFVLWPSPYCVFIQTPFRKVWLIDGAEQPTSFKRHLGVVRFAVQCPLVVTGSVCFEKEICGTIPCVSMRAAKPQRVAGTWGFHERWPRHNTFLTRCLSCSNLSLSRSSLEKG